MSQNLWRQFVNKKGIHKSKPIKENLQNDMSVDSDVVREVQVALSLLF